MGSLAFRTGPEANVAGYAGTVVSEPIYTDDTHKLLVHDGAGNKYQVSDKNYVHDQSSPSANWTVTHNLKKKPAVIVLDSAGDVCHGEIVYNSDDQLTLNFSAAFSGTAYLN